MDRPKLPLSRLLIPTVALLLVGAGGLWAWQSWRSQQRAQQTRVDNQTVEAVRQDLSITIAASGTVQPITPVNISPKQPGRLVALSVDQGDRVTAGQELARMDASNLQGPLLQAQGALEEAQANLRELEAGNRPQQIGQAEQALAEALADLVAIRSSHARNQALYQSGALSQADRDRSQADYGAAQARLNRLQQELDLTRAGARPEQLAAAQAQVVQAQGALQTLQTQLNDTVIRAPFAGLITQKYADVGAFVTPTTSASATSSATSSSIVALASDLEAVANVAETDIRHIRVGQTVALQVDAYPDRPFKGQVRRVAPASVVVQNVTSFQVRIRILDDLEQQLRSGMNLTALFQVQQRPQALVIPTMAILNQRQGMGVYVLSARDEPEFRPIQVGATVDGQTEVLEGLAVGERVFTTFPGQRQPQDQPVKPSTFGAPAGGGRPTR
jgi:HlyD family secretion protein